MGEYVSYLFVYPRLDSFFWIQLTKISQRKVLVARTADGLTTPLLLKITSLFKNIVSLRGTPSIEMQAAGHEGLPTSYR
jgi:hypothetical protein